MERIVTQVQFSAIPAPKYKRVAAYARVSSGKDALSGKIEIKTAKLIQFHFPARHCQEG